MTEKAVRVVICGHDLKFLRPFIQQLEGSPRYSVRILTHSGHLLSDQKAAEDALAWADVIFCEWALGNAEWFSQRKRSDQVLVVRLHLQEVQARDRINFIWTIDWSKVDRLILITHHVYDWMRQQFPALRSRAALLYNPIPALRDLNRPKDPSSRYVLGLVGVVPARKRLDLAVRVLEQLRQHDERFVLRVKGSLPSEYPWMAQRKDELAWYDRTFAQLRYLQDQGVVIFDPHGPDMPAWYADIGHILSLSDFEGSHQAVAEAMASGAVPAIRDWEGAERIYPAKYVAPTIEGIAEIILRNSQAEVFEDESTFCRNFAQSQFDELRVCEAMETIIAQELRQNHPQRSHVFAPDRRSLLAAPSVLIVAYIPMGSRSGYRIRVEQEIQALIQQGCIVHLACLLPPALEAESGTPQHLLEQRKHADEFSEMGCSTHLIEVEDFFRMHADNTSFPLVTERLINLIQAFHIDVIHAEALYCARIAASVKAAMQSILFSIDWHGVVPEEARMGGAHENRVKALEAAERKMLMACDLNVFVSRAMERHYRAKYNLHTLPSVEVPCCVSAERFVSLDAMSVTWSPPAEQLTFGYAGTMADWQCGLEMMQLFAALQKLDSQCKFMLLVPTSDHPKVLDFAKRTGLPDSAYSLESVAHADVPRHLMKADVAVLLRRDDPVNRVSSPTKFGEYLAAGIPVLMTEGIGDSSELAREVNVGMLVPPEHMDHVEDLTKPDTLRAILRYALDSKAHRRAVAGRCQQAARDHLTWEYAARRWIRALQDVADCAS